ncbi:MAG TPA: hypothetical protein VHI13_04410 [Candidatus Kapabacteria bacterium]|nr:hypothetical protein [Candidatus Kapabacteria bacterium]
MNQQTLSNLATAAGRAAYQEYWNDLVVEQQSAVVPSLFGLWRTAAFGGDMAITMTGTSYKIAQPLGVRVGTRIFMEEIIVRHYFNNVQALVYFGAVILLVFLGLRFAGLLSERVALIGIAIEAMMLLMLFTVLFYAPEDDLTSNGAAGTQNGDAAEVDEGSEDRQVIREVLGELEDIGGSYATLAMRLEQSAHSQEDALRELSNKVTAIQGLSSLETHAERLDATNLLLNQLVVSIEAMSQRIDMLFGKELEFYVRKEFERIVGRAAPEGGEQSGASPYEEQEQ